MEETVRNYPNKTFTADSEDPMFTGRPRYQEPDEMTMFQSIVIIQLQRIYDLLLLGVPGEQAQKISQLHESGRYLAPEPSMAEDAPEG